MLFSPTEISQITSATATFNADAKDVFTVQVDSRMIFNHEEALFVSLPGNRTHGNQFIESLYEKGCRNFLVHEGFDKTLFPDANFYEVDDVLVALQKLAAFNRKRMPAKVIAITGSNGKTIVKEWLYSLCKERCKSYRSPASYNSQIGVALSLCGIEAEHEVAIIEAGVSQKGEMDKLEVMIKPDMGILTNIGSAHDAGYDSRAEKLEEKLALFKSADYWIYKEESIATLDSKVTLPANCHPWSYKDKGVESVKKSTQDGKTSIQIQDWEEFSIPFLDSASIDNAVQCAVILKEIFKGQKNDFTGGFCALKPLSMRGEIKKGISNTTIVSDFYNSDLQSLNNILSVAQEANPTISKTLFLSDFEDQGGNEAFLKEVYDLIRPYDFKRVFLIGNSIDALSGFFNEDQEINVFSSTDGFIRDISNYAFSNELILLKGSRKFAFEELEKLFTQPVFGTRLEIDLEALGHNWNRIDAQIKPGVKKMAMIKAGAYGSGFIAIARYFQEHQADYFGVAYANEGVELREAGITLPIMVMNAEASAYSVLLKYHLEPEIHNFWQLEQFLEVANAGIALPVHLKIDTGMHRLGFDKSEVAQLIEKILSHREEIIVKSVLSHLSSSDIPEEDNFTHEQIDLFKTIVEKCREAIPYPIMAHILNSSGLSRFGDNQFDMVRLGIILYGIDPGGLLQSELKPVHEFKSYIAQLKTLPYGTTVGYGRDGKLSKDSKIATIPVGYADGLPRNVGGGKFSLLINGTYAPIIGRVCMDMCMIDVTDIRDVSEGDEVIIFGESNPLQELAVKADTIPYEILSRIGNRVERVFVKA